MPSGLLVQEELGAHAGGGRGAVAAQLARIQEVVQKGTAAQQAASVLVLRLLPIVPFSASNYFLGLTPLAFPPFIAGTALGELFWALLYGELGAPLPAPLSPPLPLPHSRRS